MRKWIITSPFVMIALIVVGGFHVIPSSRTETCFQQIEIGMPGIEAWKILEEHKFELSSDYGTNRASFVNLSERMSITLSSTDEGEITAKEIVPHECFMQRVWRCLFDMTGNDLRPRTMPDVFATPPEESKTR